ncbi:hypothetical protein BJ165DRAFT_1341635 [Panaeolus papilionaceus]|nr:hypothetical protein BJ165DRAFT_1342135 [Panaeolus papilionaceus]KAF9050470.1 hypothetical protein BJ165DRAFT_1341635 [Panaeolus papilionaceus]
MAPEKRSPCAIWTHQEVKAFLEFLVEHISASGDNANFKATTFRSALPVIAPYHKQGPQKTVKMLQNKWASLRALLLIIRGIQSCSGWTWDDKNGAGITPASSSSWDDYVKKHKGAAPFRNKGWRYLSFMDVLIPSSRARGSHTFYPASSGSSDSTSTGSGSNSGHIESPESTDNEEADDEDAPESDNDEPDLEVFPGFIDY